MWHFGFTHEQASVESSPDNGREFRTCPGTVVTAGLARLQCREIGPEKGAIASRDRKPRNRARRRMSPHKLQTPRVEGQRKAGGITTRRPWGDATGEWWSKANERPEGLRLAGSPGRRPRT